MGRIFKKYERGAATNYITRKAALKKLQLSLKDFRRLCILKGVHPHEPRHKKTVNKGSTEIKTWYYAKDIQFLLHEPIIQKFRDYKVFLRRLKRARSKREKGAVSKLLANKPTYKVDHVVKERYPTFIDAIRDLDDGLCLLFLFSRLPRSLKVTCDTVKLCRRLTVEFMHYVIESRSLRKVFVSVKGIYYQAEIIGQTVNWIVAHERALPNVSQVDFQVMATFVEFYSTALKFVNFRLFQELGLHYPPQIGKESLELDDFDLYAHDIESMQERLYSLNENLKKDIAGGSSLAENQIQEPSIDQFPDNQNLLQDDESTKKEKDRQRLKRLFEKCKFFLSRETPRESLTFVIRSCGGTVSWDKTASYGSSYQEDDETITHQVVDRPLVPGKKQFLSRRYVQPQWIYDCVNQNILLPVEDYVPGAILPPHLSPFVELTTDEYVPPEKVAMLEQQGHDTSNLITFSKRNEEIEDEENEEEESDENDSGVEEEGEEVVVAADEKNSKRQKKKAAGNNTTTTVEKLGSKMTVSTGKLANKKNLQHKANVDKSENKKMREMMIPKKQKRVYEKIIKKKKHISKEAQNLKAKREQIEREKNKRIKATKTK